MGITLACPPTVMAFTSRERATDALYRASAGFVWSAWDLVECSDPSDGIWYEVRLFSMA